MKSLRNTERKGLKRKEGLAGRCVSEQRSTGNGCRKNICGNVIFNTAKACVGNEKKRCGYNTKMER